MSKHEAESILANLRSVEAVRARRRAEPKFNDGLQAVKRFQHARFERTYADLLQDTKRHDAARFFLDDLYGPHDFSERDAQFARIVPALVRLFPADIITTVRTLSDLHALAEQLDAAMADQLSVLPIALPAYSAAWREVGRSGDRQQQIDWMTEIGRDLLRYTRQPLLRHSLRMMRGPARAAGLAKLQQFLERGFDIFRRLPEAEAFLDLIAARERTVVNWLFNPASEENPPWGLGDSEQNIR